MANLTGLAMCDRGVFQLGCHPEDYNLSFHVSDESCTYWLVCNLNRRKKAITCEDVVHKWNSILCVTIRCPPKAEGGA